MSDNQDWGEEYSKLADLYAIKCNEVRELKEKNKQIKIEAVKEFVKAYIKEYKHDCTFCNREEDYCCLKCFRDRWIKEQKGDK